MLRVTLVLALALSVGCGSSERARPRASGDRASEAEGPELVEPTAEVLPAARSVSFTTSDGVSISGTLQAGGSPDAPLVVLVHQLSSDRSEWAPLLERLHRSPAIATLAIDLRGHGASTTGPTGRLDWQGFDAAAWALTRNDVRAALAFVTGRDSGLHPARVAAIGSSIGSSAVIAAAAEEPSLTTLVTLSPGRAYHGFDAITPALGLTDRAILAVVASDEVDSVNTAETYARIGHAEPLILEGNAHGVDLFTLSPSSLDRVEAFLREHLGQPRVGLAAPTVRAPETVPAPLDPDRPQ